LIGSRRERVDRHVATLLRPLLSISLMFIDKKAARLRRTSRYGHIKAAEGTSMIAAKNIANVRYHPSKCGEIEPLRAGFSDAIQLGQRKASTPPARNTFCASHRSWRIVCFDDPRACPFNSVNANQGRLS
jgi:hypothetical protein